MTHRNLLALALLLTPACGQQGFADGTYLIGTWSNHDAQPLCTQPPQGLVLTHGADGFVQGTLTYGNALFDSPAALHVNLPSTPVGNGMAEWNVNAAGNVGTLMLDDSSDQGMRFAVHYTLRDCDARAVAVSVQFIGEAASGQIKPDHRDDLDQ